MALKEHILGQGLPSDLSGNSLGFFRCVYGKALFKAEEIVLLFG